MKKSGSLLYCVRVTANGDEPGEQYLYDFQDSEKNLPTILTTPQKLSTGVDACNVRNIVPMPPINSMTGLKQATGRSTRLYDGNPQPARGLSALPISGCSDLLSSHKS